MRDMRIAAPDAVESLTVVGLLLKGSADREYCAGAVRSSYFDFCATRGFGFRVTRHTRKVRCDGL